MRKLLLSILTITAFGFGANAQFDQAFHTGYASNSSVTVPTITGSNLLFQSSFTVEAWIRPSNFANGSVPQYHIVESYGGSTGGYALRHESGYYKFYKLNGGSSDVVSSSTFYNVTAYPTHHVAATYDASTNELKIYVNGALEGTVVTTMTDPIQQNNMYIGAQGDGGAVHRNTDIDDVRIWGVAKTQTQIQNDMNTCLSGTETGLLAHYTFDDSNTATILDNTSNGNDGSIFSFNSSTSYVTGLLECCTVTIPDANFKTYLVGNAAINTNGDTEIQCSEASGFTGTIDCNTLSISDLTGVEAFTSLTILKCFNNSITSLDLTQNTALTLLSCYFNIISNLDVTQNMALADLYCDYNYLSSLDVTQNFALTSLECSNNVLTSLDLTQNTSLINLNCQINSLTSLNIANGNNTNITSGFFFATSNPNLTCIQVDNVAYSTTNWTDIDAASSFSTNCNGTTGVNEITTQNISVYPNPAISQLTLNTTEQIVSITILDITGKTVKTIVSNNNVIDVSNLTKGIYFLQIQTENGIANSKFIKE